MRAASPSKRLGLLTESPAAIIGAMGTLGEQRTLGRETDGGGAWGGFATALVK